MEKEMKKKEQLKLNHQIASKEERGITLITLVVTIVVLLILAGITISLVFGSNGVIQKAQDSKEQTEIGEMREKLEMAKVPVYADGNGSYKVQDYWNRIESEGLIADKTVDIIDNGDGTYEVTTTPGYVFEITVEPNKEIAENIIIGECIGKGENLSIGIRIVNKTTNSIEIEVVRAEGASNFKYSIKKQGEEYGAAEEKSEKTHVFNGLTQGGIYTIKVEATKEGEQQIVEKPVQVGEIPLAIDGDIRWTGNGQAEVRIYTNETGYQLEWQKNGISEGSWTREASGVKEKTITGLVNGDIIYARLYDGTSSGKNANIEVRDDIDPTATIKLSGTAVEIGKPLTAEVAQTDNESGINISQTKWVFNTEAGNIGTEASKYTGGTFTRTPETITLLTTAGGTYYLHVLTVDNAGNKKEIISEKIEITSVPNYWKKTTSTDPEWYNYGTEVNAPKLGTGMTPIVYIGENKPTEKKWAPEIIDALYAEVHDDFILSFIGTDQDAEIVRFISNNHDKCVGFRNTQFPIVDSLPKRMGKLRLIWIIFNFNFTWHINTSHILYFYLSKSSSLSLVFFSVLFSLYITRAPPSPCCLSSPSLLSLEDSFFSSFPSLGLETS